MGKPVCNCGHGTRSHYQKVGPCLNCEKNCKKFTRVYTVEKRKPFSKSLIPNPVSKF